MGGGDLHLSPQSLTFLTARTCVCERERQRHRERERQRSMLEMLDLCSKMLEGEREREMIEMLERERESSMLEMFFSTFSLLSVSENKTSRPAGIRTRVNSFAFAWKLLDFSTKHTVVLQSVTRTCVSDSVVPEF